MNLQINVPRVLLQVIQAHILAMLIIVKNAGAHLLIRWIIILKFFIDKRCYECYEGYYVSSYKCYSCSSSCSKCAYLANNCTSCNSYYYLYENTCYSASEYYISSCNDIHCINCSIANYSKLKNNINIIIF